MLSKERGNATNGNPIDLAGAEFAAFAAEDAEDGRILKASLWLAIGVHLVLLAINFPALDSRPLAADETQRRVFVVRTPRFKQPPPPPTDIPVRRVRRTPMPDATPDDPEPLRLHEPQPEIELHAPDFDFAIPSAPPSLSGTGEPMVIGGDVRRPVKVHAPPPRYTEIARKARIEGIVVVQAIVDRRGDVTGVKVLKALPMGLTEEAVEAVRRWKFEPATLNGKPVDVYFNLTVKFTLQ